MGVPKSLLSTTFIASWALGGQASSLKLLSLAAYWSRAMVTPLTAYSWYFRLEVWA